MGGHSARNSFTAEGPYSIESFTTSFDRPLRCGPRSESIYLTIRLIYNMKYDWVAAQMFPSSYSGIHGKISGLFGLLFLLTFSILREHFI